MISIIIPVYNVENYLNRCIKSVVSQSYYNIQIILVNDGSTDKSDSICDEWSDRDKRIKVVHQNNAGVSVARNVGLSMALGDAVLFLDPDDEIEVNMVSDMAQHLFEDDVDVVCCGYVSEYSDKSLIYTPKMGIISAEECMEGAFGRDIISVVWNKMFKRYVLFNENGQHILFPVGISIGEDFVWLACVLKNCKSAFCIDKAYYHWYHRADGATGFFYRDRIDDRALTELDALEQVVEICKSMSPNLYYLACVRLYGILIEKLKSADLKNNIKVSDIVCGKLKCLIKHYPIKKFQDFIRIFKVKVLFILRRIGLKTLVLFFEHQLAFNKILRIKTK